VREQQQQLVALQLPPLGIRRRLPVEGLGGRGVDGRTREEGEDGGELEANGEGDVAHRRALELNVVERQLPPALQLPQED